MKTPHASKPAREFRTSFYDEIRRNKRKSYLLMAAVVVAGVVLVLALGELFEPGMGVLFAVLALPFVLLYTGVTYYYGDRIALASVNAKPLDDNTAQHRQLRSLVENLALANRLPPPKLYVIESPELNAFATGRDPAHASVAVTTGLMNTLDRTELEGVIAHELSHVGNYDIRFATLIAVMVGLIAIIATFLRASVWFGGGRRDARGGGGAMVLVALLLAIFAPLFVRVVQLAISRQREFLADASGAKLTRYPEGLARALEKIKSRNQGRMQASEAVSHLFFSDPTHAPLSSVFATHPPIDERIRRLRAM